MIFGEGLWRIFLDLNTTYMGLQLKNPLIASSSPLCQDLDTIKSMEDAGAAGIVLHSLFEEQAQHEAGKLDENLLSGTESFDEAINYFPETDFYHLGPEEYLKHLQKAKAAVDIPVFGSLNGVSTGGWIDYAQRIEEAGASGLELNIYFLPTSHFVLGNQVEQLYITLVKEVVHHVSVPVAVKLSPYFSSLPNIMKRFDQAGASALVLFNRFYQPDIDVDEMTVQPKLTLSTSAELALRIRWTSILSPILDADIAVTGGVHSSGDAIKSFLAGAKVAMMTSAILKNGPDYFSNVLKGVEEWMEKKEYDSISEFAGLLNHANIAEPAAYERANYIKILGSFK